MPFAVATAFAALILIRAGTSPVDLVRYALYAGWRCAARHAGVPGSARAPHTLVDDLAMGAAVGLVLELAGWALFSAARPSVVRLALAVAGCASPSLAIPTAAPTLAGARVRRDAPSAWSWAVAGVVCFFTAYLAAVFLDRNPIIPPSDATRQYLDLSYQLSLAGEADARLPARAAAGGGRAARVPLVRLRPHGDDRLVGHIDLPVVALRLADSGAVCARDRADRGRRLAGQRPATRGRGRGRAVLRVGEFNFTDPVTLPFGTQATFVIWHGMSMIYSLGSA